MKQSVQIRDVWIIALAALGYFAASYGALMMPGWVQVIAVVWPAAGVGLAVLLLNRRSLWGPLLAGMFLAGVTADYLAGNTLFISSGFMVANLLETTLSAWMILSLCKQDVSFDRIREVLLLVLAATVINACTAALGGVVASQKNSQVPFGVLWLSWLVGNGLGILIITPLIVVWARFWRSHKRFAPKKVVEAIIFSIIWVALCELTFSFPDILGLFSLQPYILVVFLVYVAFRFQQPGATAAVSVMTILILFSDSVEFGPLLWAGKDPVERIFLSQVFVVNISVTAFLLSAALSERKQVEEALQKSEARFRSVFEQSASGYMITGLDGRFLKVNEALSNILGYTIDELEQLNFRDLTHPDDIAISNEGVRQLLSGQQNKHQLEKRYVHKDGSVVWAVVSISLVRNDVNEPLYFVTGLMDITREKRAEQALRESQNRYQLIFENSGTANAIFDTECRMILQNGLSEQSLGVEPGAVINKTVLEIFGHTQGSIITARMQRVLDSGISETHETKFTLPSGEKWFRSIYQPLFDDHRKLFGVQIISQDVTERLRIEEQIKKALAEKETLLRELHHRTKNNMGTISAMLDLQMAEIEDSTLQNRLAETQTRIRSMALVHQKLYEADNLSYLNLKDYTSDLLELLMSSHHAASFRIGLTQDLEDVFVLIDTAIPYGLIVNELCTNAMKYAFPENRRGEMQVGLRKLEDDTIEFVFADNGVGFPSGFNPEKDGHLGLQIVHALGESQLGGKVAFLPGQGVTCQVHFRDNLYNPRV